MVSENIELVLSRNIKVENNVIHRDPDPKIKPEPNGLAVLLFNKIKQHRNNIAQVN